MPPSATIIPPAFESFRSPEISRPRHRPASLAASLARLAALVGLALSLHSVGSAQIVVALPSFALAVGAESLPAASASSVATDTLTGGAALPTTANVVAAPTPVSNHPTPDGSFGPGTVPFGPASVIQLAIGGTTPGSSSTLGQYDQTTVVNGGTIQLQGGALQVSLINNFVPVAGNNFLLFSYVGTGTVSGAFGTFDFSHAVLSSTVLGWDTSQIYTTGVVSVDRANYFWTGTDSSAWGNDSGNTDLGNFTATDSAGSAPQNNNLFSFSNVFLSMAGAANATAQTLGGNSFTINSLSFIAGGNTLSGGGATLTLSAANAFQDQTTKAYAAGIGLVMQAGAASATLDTDIIIALGTNQIWEIDSNPANPLTLNGEITDNNNNVLGVNKGTAFSLTKTGTGTLIFNDGGVNSYVGGTNVAAGLLFLMSGAALGESTGYGTLTMSGGTLDLNGTTQSVNGLSLSSGVIMDSLGGGFLMVNTGSFSATNNALSTNATQSAIVVTTPLGKVSTLAASVVDGLNVSSTGNGNPAAAVLTMVGTGSVVLSGTNSYSGGTRINSGTVKVIGTGILGDPAGLGTLTVSGGTLDVGGTQQVVNTISLSAGTITDSVGGGKITSHGGVVATGIGTSSLAATVAGTGGLTKSGTGVLNVLADEIYTGVTDIQSGDVQMSSFGQFGGGGAVTVDSSGILSGTGTVSGGVSVASGGRLSPGTIGTGSAGRLSLGSATLSSGSSLSFNLNSTGGNSASAGTSFGQLLVNGALDFNSLTVHSVTLTLSPEVSNNLLGAGSSFTWASVISAGSVIGSFASSDFLINSTAFAPGTTGTFALIQDALNGDNFDLTFTGAAIPEPSVVALLAGAGVFGFAVRRRRSVRGVTGLPPDRKFA